MWKNASNLINSYRNLKNVLLIGSSLYSTKSLVSTYSTYVTEINRHLAHIKRIDRESSIEVLRSNLIDLINSNRLLCAAVLKSPISLYKYDEAYEWKIIKLEEASYLSGNKSERFNDELKKVYGKFSAESSKLRSGEKNSFNPRFKNKQVIFTYQ